jgi:beta-glucosidase
MADLGARAYRFSIAWPRVFPTGSGQANDKGLDFYSRLVDALLGAGIEPFATLYHWDLPQALQDRGGWQARDTAQAFADYAGYVAQRLGDRVRHFLTLNEFHSFVDLGYRGSDLETGDGPVRIELAPGLRLADGPLNQVRHHAVLAHGLAVQAVRAMARPGTRCGPADNLACAVPAVATPEQVAAARLATRALNAAYLTVILEGKYPDSYLEAAGADAPKFTDADLRVIATPVDFVGINVYGPSVYVVSSDERRGYEAIPFSASHPRMRSAWQLLGPEVMYWAPRQLQSLWGVTEIYITENGCAASDELGPGGRVCDSDRIMFMRAALGELQRAAAEGVPVKGYFHWSLLDNFEWREGFAMRFGLVHVDFATQKRTPKLSASYFREAATRNAVV